MGAADKVRLLQGEIDRGLKHIGAMEDYHRLFRVDVPRVRPRALGGETYRLLHEIMRFRHFRRYYFDRNYDRDRLAEGSGERA